MRKFENKFIRLELKYWINAIILGAIFSINSVKLIHAENVITPQLIEEAQVLAEKEAQFVDARITIDWDKIHGLQHPDFRKKISVDEVRYFEGWVAYDYRKKAKQNVHISGAFVPTLDFIKKYPNKLDPLGFPVPRRYVWSNDPFLKIKSYSLEKISISKNRKYAKVRIMTRGRQRLNPAIVRGNFEFDAQYPLTDYWEKVEGDWVITLLSAPIAMSGAGILKYYLPNDKSGWGKADFVEINPEDLKLP